MRAMIVDDEPDREQIETIQKILRDEFHLVVDEPYMFLAKYGKDEFCSFVEKLDEPPDIAIIDYFLDFKAGNETWHGGEVARFLQDHWKDKKPFYILFVSAYLQRAEGRYETLVELIGRDHFLVGFLELSGEWATSFRQRVRSYLETVKGEGRREIEDAIESLGEDKWDEWLGRYKGGASAVIEIFKTIKKVAPTDVTVLIRGESGTGKELIARDIHEGSSRASQQFVAVNCAALAAHLLESELFGHIKGAFTGADRDKVGRFQLAENGTLFLDEIGDISPAIQVKLLRVLQDKIFQRVGESTDSVANVRIIAATNSDLEKKIKEGEFRSDLFYRLSVLPIFLPPLRERKDDIIRLADYFLKKFNRDKMVFTKDGGEWLTRYHWPGNARELENLMERVAYLEDGHTLNSAALQHVYDMGHQQPADQEASGAASLDEMYNLAWLEADKAFKRLYFTRALTRFGGDKTQTANAVGVRRETVERIVTDLGLSQEVLTLRLTQKEEAKRIKGAKKSEKSRTKGPRKNKGSGSQPETSEQ